MKYLIGLILIVSILTTVGIQADAGNQELIINAVPGLPDWTNSDVNALRREIQVTLDRMDALNDRIEHENLPENQKRNVLMDRLESENVLGNFIAQAWTRDIPVTDLVDIRDSDRISEQTVTAILQYLHYYENLRFYHMGDEYSPHTYSGEITAQVMDLGGDWDAIQSIEPGVKSRATPSGQYDQVLLPVGMTDLTGYTNIWLQDDSDNTYTDIPIGFGFYFYEDDDPDVNTWVRVSTNGYIAFYQQGGGAMDGTDSSNDVISSGIDPDGYVAGWWDDLIVHSTQGSADRVSYKTEGSTGAREFTVEYFSITRKDGDATDYHYFQIKLSEATQSISLNYSTMWTPDTLDTATIGMENFGGTDGDCGPNCSNSNTQRPGSNYMFVPAVPGESCADPFIISCGDTDVPGTDLTNVWNSYDETHYGCGIDFSGGDEVWMLDLGATHQQAVITLDDSFDATIDLIVDDSCPPDGDPFGCYGNTATICASGILYIYVDCPSTNGERYSLSVDCYPPSGNVFNVPGDYPLIQDAIYAACDGDTVLLADGTYTGFKNTDLSFMGKDIILESVNGPSNCTIDCQGVFTGITFNHGETTDAILRDITIARAVAGSQAAGVVVNGASPTIRGCIIDYCAGSNIMILNGSSPVIDTCTISRSTNSGIMINSGSSPKITDCIVTTGWNKGIVVLSDDCQPIITDNTITGNSGEALQLYASNCGDLLGNTLDTDIYVIGNTITEDAVWNPQISSTKANVAFYISSTVAIQGTSGPDNVTVLTLNPCVTLKMGSTMRIYVGHDSNASPTTMRFMPIIPV